MARIVIACWGSYGDVNPYLGLARALAARGHRPLIVMPPYYAAAAAHAGIAFFAARPHVDPNDRALMQRIMDPKRGSEAIIRELILPVLDASYRDLCEAATGADLLLSHPVTFAAPVLAEHRGLKWVSTILSPLSFFSAFDVPAFPVAPWLKSWAERARWLGPLLVGVARRATERWVAPVTHLRVSLGLGKGRNAIFEGQHSPYGVLAMFSRVLARSQPDWPPRTIVTGQVSYDAALGDGLSPELEAFLAAGPPPVVFTLGTSAVLAPGDFYEQSIAAVRRLGVRAILLAGPDARRLDPLLTDAIVAVDKAPHSHLFPRAAVIVQHCGIGTIGQALRAGRPVLAVPYAHDQPDNAWRVARLGLARVLRPPQYRPARVARELGRLLTDASYEAAAARAAEVARHEDGAAVACDAIEAVLEDRPLPQTPA